MVHNILCIVLNHRTFPFTVMCSKIIVLAINSVEGSLGIELALYKTYVIERSISL